MPISISQKQYCKGVYFGRIREKIADPAKKKAKKEENCALKTEKLLVFPYFFPVFDKIKLIFYEKV